MNTGISKKVFITNTVFIGLIGAMTNAETEAERLLVCYILGGCFALYIVVQCVIDCSKKEKGNEQ